MSSDCLFCKIIAGEIPGDVVHETEDTLAFRDISPQAPQHVLVIPKLHAATLPELMALDDGERLAGKLWSTVAAVAEQEGMGDGFRTVVNTGERAAQSVFHVHIHVLSGRILGWPPG